MKKQNRKTSSVQNDVVKKFVAFQATGAGFDGVWADIGPFVEDFARRSLRNLGVSSALGDDDDQAIGEVVNETVLRLERLARPDAGGKFDPARAQPGVSGLKGWLWRVVERLAIEWVRDWRGGRGLKITPECCLEWNEFSDDEGTSFLDRQVAKMERPDLLPILEACIAELPDPLMRELVSLKLDQELSVRRSAEQLDLTDSMVQRRLTTAYALLRPMLEARGVDASWLAA